MECIQVWLRVLGIFEAAEGMAFAKLNAKWDMRPWLCGHQDDLMMTAFIWL